MDWAWVIPVVALIVWILSQVSRAGQANPPQPPPRPAPRKGRSSTEEIDRFLEEINRRREQQKQQQQQARREVVEAVPVEEVLEVKRERPKPPPRQRPTAPPPRRKPVVPSAEAVTVLPPQQTIPTPEPVPEAPGVLPPVEEVGSLEFRPIAPVPQRQPSPTLVRLREMLTAQGIRTAILVNELLARPKCLRRPFRR